MIRRRTTRTATVLLCALWVLLTGCTAEQVWTYQHVLDDGQRAAVDAELHRQAAVRESGPTLPPFLICVRHRESGDDYTQENRTSSASGAFQFLDGTWRSVTAKSGIGTGYARASHAPPAVQDAVAIWTYHTYGTQPWAATRRGC